eukprot:SAG31_NODE_8316_length_1475_cov_1.656977_3_plen_106_part_01
MLRLETEMMVGLKCTLLEARQYLLMAHLDIGDAIDLFIREHNSSALLSVPSGQVADYHSISDYHILVSLQAADYHIIADYHILLQHVAIRNRDSVRAVRDERHFRE